MKTKVCAFSVLVAFIWLLPSVVGAQAVDCDTDPPGALQAAINAAAPTAAPVTITVTGTCNENVIIGENKHRLTLDGQGIVSINGPDTTFATVSVRGRAITIKGFTITGGQNGVNIMRGGTAIIDGNTIQSTGSNGINVFSHSFARIVNNTIQNNPASGINVNENSFARIGFLEGDDMVATPNTIQNNGANGIGVFRSSNARIIANTISTNTGNGVFVNSVSHADIASNTIDGNTGDGILVGRNSGVDLGRDTGDTIFDLPNSTTIGSENGGFGIRCFINSYMDGRQGTLNGASGDVNFTGGCINSLMP